MVYHEVLLNTLCGLVSSLFWISSDVILWVLKPEWVLPYSHCRPLDSQHCGSVTRGQTPGLTARRSANCAIDPGLKIQMLS